MTGVAINTDVGEGFGPWRFTDDEALLDHVTAANIACGFHAGDPDILRRTCAAAVRRGVAIGAQVSYRDLAGFGRRFIDVPTGTLVNDLLYQIGALRIFAEIAGGRVDYVKAHGALYNTAATHREHAAALVEAVATADPALPLLCQPGTEVWRQAEDAGLRPLAEAFADRGYDARGLLVPRDQPGALVTDREEAARRVVRMVVEGRVTAVTGEDIPITPAALCVHSDTAGALELASAVASALREAGVSLTPIR
ncbi:LamB/YcsF family protein [Sciscionella sediminilitoris]|uniref:LamB/YcsF family protein n=1 Tax=Sciscionella sediminilitoris TaxID=1445613 RepID=UPI0004DEF50E|nr:5-oxoprolinase subunit PxpA [Sciscionella sp. SE31]